MDQKPSFLNRMRQKWNVKNEWQVIVILIIFALGGSMCGFLGKRLLNLFQLENGIFKAVIYILLVSILWPVCVLIVSYPFGQFSFFRSYITRLGRRIIRRK